MKRETVMQVALYTFGVFCAPANAPANERVHACK